MRSWFRSRARQKSRPIDTALWRKATASWLFMRGVSEEESERLRAISGAFLAGKHFSGTHDLEITDLMMVEIAAQASILVLELGIEWYDGWSEVIVYPSQFAPEREEVDEDGVVHVTNHAMYGEGNYKATRQYNEGMKEHVQNHDIEKEARDAAPESAAEEKEMEDAERIGKSRARGAKESPDAPETEQV
jgi:hypothetical protein